MPEFTLPEFTRSLRALAVPSAPGSDHDQIFGPLIHARTLSHRASSMEAQIAAFDAARLERAWRAAIVVLAEARHKRSLPDQRALTAELELLGEPVWAALVAVRAAAASAKKTSAMHEERRVAWEAWVRSVQLLFSVADDWWRAALPVLSGGRDHRGTLRRLSRVLRRTP